MSELVATSQQGLVGKYKPYPEYKDSGISRLGNIPNHWQSKKLKRMASIENGRDYKHIEVSEGFPVIGSGGQFTWSSEYIYNGESVLLGRKGTVDRPLYIDGPFWTVDTMFYTKVYNIIPAKFLYYAALTIEFGLYSTNTALPSMTQEDLGNVYFGSPTYEEAENIAAFLDYETARIDRLIAQQQRLIELLKEKRQAVISHAVTKGLNSDAPMKDSGIEWLGQVPEHWVVTKVKDATYRIVDGPHFSPKYQDEGYMFISARNIKVDRWSLDDAKYVSESDFLEFNKRVKPESGDVLLTKGGTTGIARVVDLDFPFQVWVHVAVLKTNKRKVNPFYLAYTLNSKSGYEQSQLYTRGATNNDLGLSRIANIYFAAPKIQEQEEIVSWLDTACSKLDYLCHRAECSMELLQERRIALISAAVTGKIDLRGWTPPAEEAAA
ncbi:restriction endonuclease subunit S [Aeromonas hydrophila]|uniref:restriction endonuclease subunit S n=1 Tax=Aeromonas hydrophila TaxID=644 RepID=UPI001CEFC159|nr:restriction endonuclease subunit S [Aeromonas hydrophila]UCM59470.1 restriction endonuclease subunit S [Aeromonas hydrophila]